MFGYFRIIDAREGNFGHTWRVTSNNLAGTGQDYCHNNGPRHFHICDILPRKNKNIFITAVAIVVFLKYFTISFA